ncbi:hypothetical protein D3C87_848070 [compost metagenome]
MKYTPTARYGLAIHTSRPPRSRIRAAAYLAAWCALVAAAVYMLMACAGVAHAQDRNYDPRLAAQRQEALAVYVRSAWCMQDASRAAFRQGFRRDADAQAFAVKMCGSALRVFLTTTPPQWTHADVDALLLGMAIKAVAQERRQGLM